MPAGRQSPGRVPKTAELVAAHIRRRIVRGELQSGEALPTESELMAEFKISRPTLREAFRVLEAQGLIIVRRGSRGGAEVQAPSGDAVARYAGLLLQHRRATLDDVFRGRIIVEPPAARMVAARRDRKRCARRLEQRVARDAGDGSEESFGPGFHRLLVELTGNQTLVLLAEVLESIQQAAISTIARSDAAALAALKPAGSLRAHSEVTELIRQGDGAGAEAAWRRHLDEVGNCLLQALGNRKARLDMLEF